MLASTSVEFVKVGSPRRKRLRDRSVSRSEGERLQRVGLRSFDLIWKINGAGNALYRTWKMFWITEFSFFIVLLLSGYNCATYVMVVTARRLY